MFGLKNRSEDDLIYTDPTAGEPPLVCKRRGLRIAIAVLIAAGLLILAVVTLIMAIQSQETAQQIYLWI